MKSVVPVLVCAIVVSACKKETPPPPAAAPSTLGPKQDDLKTLGEFLSKDAPAADKSGLPPGHPPLTSEPAGTTAGLPSGHPPIGAAADIPPPSQDEPDAITYSAPSEWKSEPVTSALRKAQFRIPGAKDGDGSMVVFYFGSGQGGGLEQNVNRWKGMFSTAEGKPVPESAVKRESLDVGGMKVTTLDITGRYVDPMSAMGDSSAKGDYRMLSAIVETPQGLWFFKGVGPLSTMNANADHFSKFVKSIRKSGAGSGK